MITIYRTTLSNNYHQTHQSIEQMILDDQSITYTVVVDNRRTMTLSRGRCHMETAQLFVPDSQPDLILYDYFDIVKWMDKQGLKLI